MRFIATGVVILALCGCGKQVRPHASRPFPEKLSAWRLFVGKPWELNPNQGVLPYDLITPLFSDYATKYRFVWMPAGTSAVYNDRGVFDFPAGAILAKTFAYKENGHQRLIETRLLVHAKDGWTPLPYVWNEAQTEAYLQVAADPVTVRYAPPSGEPLAFEYTIPNVNQCKECHEKSKTTVPIGPKARNLNKDFAYADGRENQLVRWTRVGYLKGAPAPDHGPRVVAWDDPSAPIEARARAYLDVNCGHCHNPEGSANTSGLYLTVDEADPLRLGLHKVPVSAGRGSGGLLFDVVEGAPAESILIHRMQSVEPKIMMPELGRAVTHREGVDLVRQWIREMQRSAPNASARP